MPHKLFNDFKRLSKMTRIDFLEYGKFCGTDWNHRGIKEPYNRLYIMLDGEGFVCTENGETKLQKGHAYLIPMNLDFDSKTIVGLHKLFVHFELESYFHINMMNGLDEILETQIDLETFEAFDAYLEDKDIRKYLMMNGEFTKLIYKLLSPLDLNVYENEMEEIPEVLHELYKLLQIKLTGRTRIGQLAEMVGISQSMLSKIFRETTGMTLKHYLKQQLMAKAQIQLISTTNSIKAIAYGLEYEDALYFTKVFHQWTGMSPTAYRKLNKIN